MKRLLLSVAVAGMFASSTAVAASGADAPQKVATPSVVAPTGDAPVPGPDGRLVFVYGQSRPVIVCAVLQECDLALQAGEHVQGLHVSDTSRWDVEGAAVGAGVDAVEHLVIKPLAPGMSSTMDVFTDRRVYHIALVSDIGKYMPYVSFVYPRSPAEVVAQLQALEQKRAVIKKLSTLPDGRLLTGLHFNYEVQGDAPFKPLRVYDDGRQTVVQFPTAVWNGEAPVLLLLEDGNGRGVEPTVVNYREVCAQPGGQCQFPEYVVDAVIRRAELVAGVGSGQQRVTITRVAGEQ